MIRSFTKALALIVLVSASFTACKKDKDDSLAITKENLVGTYTLKSVIWIYDGKETNVYDLLPACDKDDETILKADGTYEVKDLGNTCGNDGTGDWETDGKALILDGTSNTIKSLTKSEVVYEETIEDNGVKLTQRTVMSRK